MPLQRRLPKRGFRRLQKRALRREQCAAINLRSLNMFAEGDIVDPAVLRKRGVIRAGDKLKILGDGDLTIKLVVRAHAFSKGAREKINAIGGAAEVIEDSTKPDA
jgi:large subunit ribosomal protein L15